METSFRIPIYAKAALIMISVFAFVFIMYTGQDIIIPLAYATIFAILLNPLVNFLICKKINKVIAITIVVLFMLAAVLVAGYFFFSRVGMFSESFPEFKIKLTRAADQLLNWYAHEFNYSRSKINKWVSEAQNDALSNYAYGEAFARLGKISVALLLVPVYLFMILYYKSLLLEFIRKLFRSEYHTTVANVLTGSKTIIQSYLVGLFFEMLIMAVLNSAGLLLLGIDYAIMLGIIAAVLNIIPYIGGIIGTVLPMLVAFVTKDSLVYPVMVLVIHIFIQFIDNNFIVPKIVASRVQINALISVIAVLAGGVLWGVSGMFLSIPLIAILKVIFDHIEPLKPWGFLLGNTVPTSSKLSFIKLKNKKS